MKVLNEIGWYSTVEFIEATKHDDILAHAAEGGN